MDIYYETNKNSTKNFLLLVFFLYILIQPLYIWTSGLPQIGDILGLLLITSAILIYKKEKMNLFSLISLILMFYIIFVNFTWGIILNQHFEAVKNSLWYVYNILIMLSSILILKYNNNAISIIKYSVIVTIIFEFIVVILITNSDMRAVGTFNNPNQLGYFSLLYLSLFYLINKKSKVNSLVFWIVTILGLLIAFYSLSKGTIISIFVLVCLEVFIKIKKQNVLKTLIIIMFLIVIGVTFSSDIQKNAKNSNLYQNVQNRLISIGDESDDTSAGRGYDRIINHSKYLILGAGEIDVSRFDSIDLEIHSSFGNLLFSYGIIGISLFMILLIIIIRKNKVINYYPLIPIFMYSLTHNGLRNPAFWIILAIMYVYKLNNKKNL